MTADANSLKTGAARKPGHTGLVLIVDADEDAAEAAAGEYETFLAAAGFRLKKTVAGKDIAAGTGLDMPREGLPDVVLLDLDRLDSIGLSLCRKIKEDNNRFTPVIVLTSDKSALNRNRAFDVGCDDYLTKPCGPEEILARIRSMIRLKRQHDEILELSLFDYLTGLRNRRYLSEVMDNEFEKARRYGEYLSAIMIDLDHFKKVNDTYGHPVGDSVLKAVAGYLRKNIRTVDCMARFGGEEFLILLPYSDASMAFAQAERIRKYLVDRPVAVGGRELRITASFGIASYPTDQRIRSAEDLIEASDRALYEAKQNGRNRSVIDPGSAKERVVKILVVDDDEPIRRLIVSSLRDKGYAPSEAKDTRSAEKVLAEDPPNLILLDIMLPEEDGFTFCRRLKKDPRYHNIPILFVSAKDEIDNRILGFELGAEDYITKPFSPRELLVRLDRVLGRHRAKCRPPAGD